MKISFCCDSYQALKGSQRHCRQSKRSEKDEHRLQPKESWQRWRALIPVLNLLVQTDPGVRQQRQAALQQQGPVRLPGHGLHGLLLPLPRMRLAQVRRGVPLRPEVALRAGRGGGRRDHKEQEYLTNEDFGEEFILSVFRFPRRTALLAQF